MKKFSFPLNRVMEWRQTEQRVARTQLEMLQAQMGALVMARAKLDSEERDTGRALLTAPRIDASDLAAWEDYRRWVGSEHRRLDLRQAELSAQAEQARRRLLDKRREATLLEHLKDKRKRAWSIDLHREIDNQASEAFLSRFNRTA